MKTKDIENLAKLYIEGAIPPPLPTQQPSQQNIPSPTQPQNNPNKQIIDGILNQLSQLESRLRQAGTRDQQIFQILENIINTINVQLY